MPHILYRFSHIYTVKAQFVYFRLFRIPCDFNCGLYLKETELEEHKIGCPSRPVKYVCKICDMPFDGYNHILDPKFTKHIFEAHKQNIFFIFESKNWSCQLNFEDKAIFVQRYGRKYFKNEYYWVTQHHNNGKRFISVQQLFSHENTYSLKTYEISCKYSKLLFQGNILPHQDNPTAFNSHDVSKLTIDKGPVQIRFIGVNVIPKEVALLLECMICKNLMSNKVINCSQGHSLCSECSLKVHDCPLCKSPILKQRNFLVESLVSAINMKCDYNYFGCEEVLSPQTLKDHVNLCVFVPVNCPQCEIKICLYNLYKHLLENCKFKPFIYKVGSTFPITRMGSKLTIFTTFGKQFIVHHENNESMAIRQISRENAEKFYFQIKLFNINENKFKQANLIDQCETINKYFPISTKGYSHFQVSVFKLHENILN